MRDYLFYNASCGKTRGLSLLIVAWRRLVRWLLLPFFQRLVVILQEIDKEREQLDERQRGLESAFQECAADGQQLRQEFDALAKRQTNLEAFHLDQDAMVRRLAALEDHVERLSQNHATEEVNGHTWYPRDTSSQAGQRACG